MGKYLEDFQLNNKQLQEILDIIEKLPDIPSAGQATPTISVDSAGLITASATQTAGYVAAGTKSATKQLTVQAAKTVTPSASAQTAVSAGKYTTGAVKVAAIPSTYKQMATGEATAAAQTSSSPYRRYVKVTGLGFTPSHVALVRIVNRDEGFKACFDGVLDNSTSLLTQTTSVSFTAGGFEVYHSWSGSSDAITYKCPNGEYAWIAWA